MTNFLKKIRLNLTLFFHGLFQGLRQADQTMLAQVSGEESDDQEITHRLELKSVYADLLRENKTEEVMETVDMSYRVAREANKYDVTIIGGLGDDYVGSDKELSAVAVKKVAMKYEKHPELFNEKTYHVTLIQDNKKIPKKGNLSAGLKDFEAAINAPEHDFVPLIELEYDGFIPRFTLENFVTKIVVRETKAGKTKLDLYIPSEAGQFTKTDAILIAELHRIMDNDLKKTDFLDIKSLRFVTDKAFGAEDLIEYYFTDFKFNKMTIFDGSFVLTFNVSPAETFDIVESHKTKSLDKKYEEMAPKKGGNSIENVGAMERRELKLAKKAASGSTNP